MSVKSTVYLDRGQAERKYADLRMEEYRVTLMDLANVFTHTARRRT
jgi:hypothetical protein